MFVKKGRVLVKNEVKKLKIAIISDFNIAGQPTMLMRAINKYTNHKARCIIARDDYMSYDKDILLTDSKQDQEEVMKWLRECDFFHFGRRIFNWEGWDWSKEKVLTQHNCCVKYYGSELRNNFSDIKEFHQKTGVSAITGTDWTITGRLTNSFYHLGSYFTKCGDINSVENLLPQNEYTDGTIRLCAGSAGSPLKGYDFLKQIVKELQDEGQPIIIDIIAGLTNKECLERKSKGHITFTSLHGAWGISGIESMFLGHVVMSCLDPWIMSLYPENPTVIISKQNLKQQIKKVIQMFLEGKDISLRRKTQKFAYYNFNSRIILKRYLYLIDLIMNPKYLDGNQNPKEIYNF